MDLKTKMEVLPCGMCEDMISCDNCLFRKEAKELYNEIYNQALEDISEKIKWQYKNYKSMPSIHLFLEIVEQLKK